MGNFNFMDWETRGPDLTVIGGLNYALDPVTRILLKTWAIDDGPVRSWVPDLSDLLPAEAWEMVKGLVDGHSTVPQEVIEHHENGGFAVAWNMAFDRHIWQQIATPELGFPEIKIENTLDCMAQAQASNLPGKLDMAGKALGLGAKTEGGSAIMKRFADPDKPLPTDRESWTKYIAYGLQDTKLLQDLWYATRPLSLEEWRDYWHSERINDRGFCVDLDVCTGASMYREEELEHVKSECSRLTGGAVTSPTQSLRITNYVFDNLPESLSQHMVVDRDTETGEIKKKSLQRQRLTRILTEISQMDAPPEPGMCEFLELMEFGRSSSAIKFQKMKDQAVDGRLTGSYVYNGAGQTGRFSSRGVQLHNLLRAKLSNELDVLDMVASHAPIEELRKLGPVSSTLAKLLRPTIVADDDKEFVWGDWSAIEARVLPWLADTRDAERTTLDPFREGEDIYVLNALDIFKVQSIDPSTKEGDKMRQAGKVACIAEGSLVLTARGPVPIELVQKSDKVWDGLGFVGHDGVVMQGYKEVFNYDGLTATADHLVWVEGRPDPIQFIEAIKSSKRLLRSGPYRKNIWVGDDNISGTAVQQDLEPLQSTDQMQRVPERTLDKSGVANQREEQRVPEVLAASASAEVVGAADVSGQEPMPESSRSEVQTLRSEGYPVQVRNTDSGGCMGLGKSRVREDERTGSHRQQRELRAGEPEVVRQAWSDAEHTVGSSDTRRYGMVGDLQPVQSVHYEEVTEVRNDESGYRRQSHIGSSRETEELAKYQEPIGRVRVYDIVNAGPNHRFTVSGVLVHNCLALGFGGSTGAYQAMARGYGVIASNAEAKVIVDGWRDRNAWAPKFWRKLLNAALAAMKNPGTRFKAGKVTYVYEPKLMRGSLICFLPCGRPIMYPWAKIERVDDKFNPGQQKDVITYLNGMTRSHMWHGKLAENITQATAASLLRATIDRVENSGMPAVTVAHTHDEIITEAPTRWASSVEQDLKDIMEAGFDWSENLPLKAGMERDWYYHK